MRVASETMASPSSDRTNANRLYVDTVKWSLAKMRPNVYGDQFRRVTIEDEYRKGLLGQGSIMLINSYANRTSPVTRGKYVLTNILGTPPPPPPAGPRATNRTCRLCCAS